MTKSALSNIAKVIQKIANTSNITTPSSLASASNPSTNSLGNSTVSTPSSLAVATSPSSSQNSPPSVRSSATFVKSNSGKTKLSVSVQSITPVHNSTLLVQNTAQSAVTFSVHNSAPSSGIPIASGNSTSSPPGSPKTVNFQEKDTHENLQNQATQHQSPEEKLKGSSESSTKIHKDETTKSQTSITSPRRPSAPAPPTPKVVNEVKSPNSETSSDKPENTGVIPPYVSSLKLQASSGTPLGSKKILELMEDFVNLQRGKVRNFIDSISVPIFWVY